MKTCAKGQNRVKENIPEGRKRKADQEEKVSWLRFNKKGKLTKDEITELSRTNKNMFSWLKPVSPLVEVVESEDHVMEVVDNLRDQFVLRDHKNIYSR